MLISEQGRMKSHQQYHLTKLVTFCCVVCLFIVIHVCVCVVSEPSYLSLNASDYYADISAFSPIGTYILTVSYNITGKSVAKIANFHYDLSGYYSDFFKIDRRQGYLTVKKQLYSSSRTYSFDVSFFYTVTYTNGTTANNYTESDIYVTAYG